MRSRIARLVLVFLILAILFYSGLVDLKVLAAAFDEPLMLGLAAILVAATIPIAAMRWWILFSRIDLPMSLMWSLRTTMIGQFLNTFLPGAYGGDVVRVALAYRATRGSIGRITTTIFVDRLSGLASLVFLGVVVLPWLPVKHANEIYLSFGIISAIIIGGTALGLVLGDYIAGLIEKLPLSIAKKLAGFIRNALNALRAYFGAWRALIWAFVLSIVQFAMVLGALMVLVEAMHFNALPKIGYIVAGVLSIAANAIPLTPGGIGIGEAAFAQIAAMFETSRSGASYGTVFLAMRFLTVMVSVSGIIPYIALRGEVEHGVKTVTELPKEE